ncbi:MAG: hypothetical protein WA584_05090 [Pyrinomonadaceae bacterium]
MKKSILFIFILLAVSLSASAQSSEEDTTSYLKGLKKVFINTGTDLNDRRRIVAEIEKAAVGLEIVETPEDAEIILSFDGGNKEAIASITTETIDGTDIILKKENRQKVATGSGSVLITTGKKIDGVRVVMNFTATQDKFAEKKPATRFTKEFIRKYKEANELK